MNAVDKPAGVEPQKRRTPRWLHWGAFILVGLIFFGLLTPGLVWDGGSWFELKVKVQNGRTPIRGANIRVIPWRDVSDPRSLEELDRFPFVTTDTNGIATMKVRCGAGGDHFYFGELGGSSFSTNCTSNREAIDR
jgi:hypothetical protein